MTSKLVLALSFIVMTPAITLAKAPVDGACGYATMVRNGLKPDGGPLACVAGEATTIEDSPMWQNAWVWTCKGLQGGKDRACHTTPVWPPKKR